MKNDITKKYLPLMVGLLLLAGCQSYQEKEHSAKVKWNHTTAKIRLDIAQQQYENGQYDSAQKVVNETLSIDPQLTDAWILSGKLSLAKGNLQQAFENFSKALETDQENADCCYMLGMVSLEMGETATAESYFTKAMQFDRSNIEYALSLGKAYIIQAKYDCAERLYAEASKRFSSDWQIKAAAGSLSMTLGRYEKAEKYYKQAAILSKDDPTVLESLGYCYIADGKWAEAADVFAKLSDIANNEQYSEILTVCQMSAGKYDKAKSRFDSVSDTQRDNPDFWLSLGQAHLGLNSANAAIACAKRALILKPNWAEATALLASGEYINKDYQSALLDFNKIKDNADIGAFAYLMIGKCYDRLGQSSKAKLAYQTSLSINPNNSYAADLAEKF